MTNANHIKYLGRDLYRVGISWYLRCVGPVPLHHDRGFASLTAAKAYVKQAAGKS